MMDLRKAETHLAWFTLGGLLVYALVETWTSLPHGLWNPFYLVDLIAMLLLFFGALHSLRARPRPAPAVLCAAYAWTAANGWRATFGRVFEILEGGELDYGTGELWAVGVGTALVLALFAFSLFLVVRASSVGD
ncbi:MAG TPA: hypothetical protein VE685_00925 [Thermoanaerobaculia bacterium]|nr:hypothetical protein [Thermoanaerobaculia bacterium]